MASYNQVSYGSSDRETVTQLQRLLNQNGANLTEDGIFGDQTRNAVLAFQRNNNLTADGVVGNQTWSKLTGGSSAATDSGFNYADYTPSDAVTQAEALLEEHLANKPGEYQSQWQAQLDEVLDSILNREDFSYDLNGDALYQQYKDQYTNQGKMAMLDTVGQTAALTGGYGNSYGQNAGQQAYQTYLQQLNDVVPELYEMALTKHNQEGEDLKDLYTLYLDRDETDYGIYRDNMSDWLTELSRLSGEASDLREWDYSQYDNERDFAYTQYIDALEDAYQRERDKVEDQQWQDEFNAQYGGYKGTGGSGGSGGSGGGYYAYDGDSGWDNGSVSDSAIRSMQSALGLAADGQWGAQSQAAAKKNWGVSSADEAYALYKKNIQGRTQGNDRGQGTGNTQKFINSHMSRSQAKSRGITDREYNAMVINWLNGVSLTDAEFAYLEDYYGIG